MSEVAPIPALQSYYQTPDTTSPAGSTELGEDAFLHLLTTQLQYQDPTDPVKNEDFVAQLAQFSSLEQLEGLNATLEGVYVALAAMNNASMASLLGTGVVVIGNTFHYDGEGPVELQFDASSDATSATVTVKDEDGTVVYTGDAGALAAGDGTFTWDGTDLSGQPLPEGTYSFEITAYDAAGEVVDVVEHVAGIVDEMDYSTGTPMPSIDGVAVNLADILSLTAGDDE